MKILLIFLSVFFGLQAKALTSEEIQSAIQGQMNQRHPDPPADFWTNLGPESLPVIKHLFEISTSPYEQSWLIDGLAHFSDPSIATLLESKIGASDNAVTKKKMLSALIQSQGDSVYDFVEPYLKDKDDHIRLSVAKGMKNYMQAKVAQDRLAQYKSEEKQAWVKEDLDRAVVLNTVKRSGSIFQHQDGDEKVVKPLAEVEWAGEWKGFYLTPQKAGPANAMLKRENKNWKVEIKLPKQTPYSLKSGEFEVTYFQTKGAHWIQVKNTKEDSVFIAQRKAN